MPDSLKHLAATFAEQIEAERRPQEDVTLEELATLIAVTYPDVTDPQQTALDMEAAFPSSTDIAIVRAMIEAHITGQTIHPLLEPLTDKFLPTAERNAERRAEQRLEWFDSFVTAAIEAGVVTQEELDTDEGIEEIIVRGFIEALDADVHLDPVTRLSLEGQDLQTSFFTHLETALAAVEEEAQKEVAERAKKATTALEAERRGKMQQLARQAGLFDGADAERITEITKDLNAFLKDVETREAAGQVVDFDRELIQRIVRGPSGDADDLTERDLILLEAARQERADRLNVINTVPVDEADVAERAAEAGQRQLEVSSAQQRAKREEEEQATRAVGQRRSEERAVAAGKILPPGPAGARLAAEPVPLGTQFGDFLKTELGKGLSQEQLALLGTNEGLLLDEFGVAKQARKQEIAEERQSLKDFAAESAENAAAQSTAFGGLLSAGISPGALLPSKLTFESFLTTEVEGFLARAETRKRRDPTGAPRPAVIRR